MNNREKEKRYNLFTIFRNPRPSQHNAFAFNENYEREKYVAAELVGRQGGNCDEIYSECEYSFLNHISYVSAANDFM